MPARAQKRATSGLTAEEFGRLFGSTKYKETLDAFTDRKVAAEEAEAKVVYS